MSIISQFQIATTGGGTTEYFSGARIAAGNVSIFQGSADIIGSNDNAIFEIESSAADNRLCRAILSLSFLESAGPNANLLGFAVTLTHGSAAGTPNMGGFKLSDYSADNDVLTAQLNNSPVPHSGTILGRWTGNQLFVTPGGIVLPDFTLVPGAANRMGVNITLTGPATGAGSTRRHRITFLTDDLAP